MMDFNQSYHLENNRALLRPMKHSDFDELLYFSLNEPELWTYTLKPASGRENLKQYIDTALAGRKAETVYPFIVIDKRHNKVVGSSRFYDYNKTHDTVQIGYTWYGKDYQGSGINKNCKYLLLEFAFEQMGIERVEFRADTRNLRSINAMKSIGCTVEGILRSDCVLAGIRIDSIILSILKTEWVSKIKDELGRRIDGL